MITNRYSLPSGYQGGVAPLISNAPKYIPNNGYQQAPYAPNAPGNQSATVTFGAAPANNSTFLIPDSNDNGVIKTFTFVYSGSPGVGTVPLVAGGGTAAQAATALAAVLAAQLTTWTASNIVVNRVTLNRIPPGINATFGGTQATGVYAYSAFINGNSLAASVGPHRVVMPYFAP